MPSKCRELTPKNIITDMLRIVGPGGLSHKVILDVGTLFGHSHNAVRVATTRLINEATIEKAEQPDSSEKLASHYRLSASTDALSLFVEEWRLGEGRIKAWQPAHWLLCHLPKNPSRTERAQSFRALSLLGFRQGPDKLWMRPDNLTKTFDQLHHQLQQFGLEITAVLMATHKLQRGVCEQWQALWIDQHNHQNYRQHYSEITRELASSQTKLGSMPAKDAMVESFRLGRNAIDLLVKDPLLPEQIESPRSRETLCQGMQEYDNAARAIWQQKINAIVRSTYN